METSGNICGQPKREYQIQENILRVQWKKLMVEAMKKVMWIAERIAEELNDTTISIIDYIGKEIYDFTISNGEKIGIVSPTYAWKLPLIVEEFFSKFHVSLQVYRSVASRWRCSIPFSENGTNELNWFFSFHFKRKSVTIFLNELEGRRD